MILVAVTLLLAIYVAWSVGANDETMALVAGTGLYSISFIVGVGALLDLLGAVLFSQKVEETLGVNLLSFRMSVLDALIVVFAIATWLVIASSYGWPVSTTHSAVGAVIGLALYRMGIWGVNWGVLGDVVLGWLLSPLLGFLGSLVAIAVLDKAVEGRYKGLEGIFRSRKLSAMLLFTWAGLTAFSRGANDVANATAFLIPVFGNTELIRVIGGAGMAAGLFMLGRRVVKNVGTELVDLSPVTALAVQLVVALILTVGTYLGLPLSGTQILVSAIIGAGIAKKVWINVSNMKSILLTWVMTFPAAAVLAYAAAAVATPLAQQGLLAGLLSTP